METTQTLATCYTIVVFQAEVDVGAGVDAFAENNETR